MNTTGITFTAVNMTLLHSMARAGNQWFCKMQYFSYEKVFLESIPLSARAWALADLSRALLCWFIPLEGIFFPETAGTARTGRLCEDSLEPAAQRGGRARSDGRRGRRGAAVPGVGLLAPLQGEAEAGQGCPRAPPLRIES